MLEFFSHPDAFKYLSIPLVAAIIGWTTNWLAIKLTFLPLEFVGIPPFLGWQGIIPSKAAKMAETAVDATISQIGSVRDIYHEVNPDVLRHYAIENIVPRLPDYVDDIMESEYPTVWQNLPQRIRKRIYQRVNEQGHVVVDGLIEDLSNNIEELLEIKHLVTHHLIANKELLNQIFIECGEEEFRFIVNSGLYFGFAFGIVQMVVWYFLPQWWVLPLFGLLVGWATNWIALNVVFRPLKPIKVGPFTLQGLFLKRQKEVAEAFTKIITHEFLTVEKMIITIFEGPSSERAKSLLRKRIKPVVDEVAGYGKVLAQLAIGPKAFAELKDRVNDKALKISERAFNDPAFNRGRAQAVQKVLRERMEALPPDKFQDLLRPCFQEDEIKLILVGAALGFVAGIAQMVFVFDIPIVGG